MMSFLFLGIVCLLTISIISFAYLKSALFLFCPLPLNMMILDFLVFYFELPFLSVFTNYSQRLLQSSGELLITNRSSPLTSGNFSD